MLRAVCEQAVPKDCVECSIRNRTIFAEVPDSEMYELVCSLKINKSHIPPKTIIYREGDMCEKSFILSSGWMVLYKTLMNGKRQILNFSLPGDFLGFELDKNGRQLYTLETLSESDLCVFPADKMKILMKNNVNLLRGYNKVIVNRNLLYAQHLVNIGRRDSKERLAAIVLELFARAEHSINKEGKKSMLFPPTQEELADMLGLTQVHVNRVMRGMMDDGIIHCDRKVLTILDESKLDNIANI